MFLGGTPIPCVFSNIIPFTCTYQLFKDQSFDQLHLFWFTISCAITLSDETKIFRGFGRLITLNPIKMNTWPLVSLVSCMVSLGSWPFLWFLASGRSGPWRFGGKFSGGKGGQGSRDVY